MKVLNSLSWVVGVAVAFFSQSDALAMWVLVVTADSESHYQRTVVGKKNMGGVLQSSYAGELEKLLKLEYPNPNLCYYAADVYGEVNVNSSHISVPASAIISGSKEWKWTWECEVDRSAPDFIWDYSVKCHATARADVNLDDSSGWGKATASSWVCVEADSVNSDPRSASVAVAAGGERVSNGFAFTGVGFNVGAASAGVNLTWTQGGTQLYAGESLTQFVTLSEIVRPGVACWIKIHTSAEGAFGEFHDTEHYGNDLHATAGIVATYASQKLNEPYYHPE